MPNMNAKRVVENLAVYLVEITAEAWADGDELMAERFSRTTATLLDGMVVWDRDTSRKET